MTIPTAAGTLPPNKDDTSYEKPINSTRFYKQNIVPIFHNITKQQHNNNSSGNKYIKLSGDKDIDNISAYLSKINENSIHLNTKLSGHKEQEKIIHHHKQTNLSYKLANNSVPVFEVTKELLFINNLESPLRFYEGVKDLGEKYGCIIVKFLDDIHNNLNESFYKDLDSFKFKTKRLLYDNTTNDNLLTKLEFYKQLYAYHCNTGNTTGMHATKLTRIPNIGKKPLDLYRLYTCLQTHGGYKNVCQRKSWPQVVRELGYPPSMIQSVITPIKAAANKIFDGFTFDCSNKRRHELNDESENCPPFKKVCCQVLNSSKEFNRLTDLLIYKQKFYFDKNGIITSDSVPIKKYNDKTFTFWHNGMAEDYTTLNSKGVMKSTYSLRQFIYRNKAFCMNILNNNFNIHTGDVSKYELSDFENVYWRLLSEKHNNLPIQVENSVSVSTKLGNPSNISKSLNFWDFTRITDESLLKYGNIDYSNNLHSKLNVSMCFSVKNWTTIEENTYLPNVNMIHLGASKLWYVIPSSDTIRFNNLMRASMEMTKHCTKTSNITQDMFASSDFYQNFINTSDELFFINNNKEVDSDYEEGNTFSISPEVYQYNNNNNNNNSNNNNIQLSVKDILKEGITVNNFVQEENSFVFTYPGATTFNLSSGVSISEEMNFCAWDWFESYFYGQISSILDEPKKLCSSEALESVPSLQLLMSIYLNGSSLESYNAQSIMQDLLKQEIEQRKLVQRMYPHLTIRYNKFDYISDISAQYTGLSKMMIWYDEDNGYKLKQLSLSEFLKYNDTLPTSKIELHLYYTTETLYFLINDYEEEEQNFKLIPLLKKIVNEDYKNEQIPIEIFEEMLIKTYRNEKDTLVWKYIKNYIESKQGEMNQVCDAFLENYNKVMTNVKVQSILDTFTLIKNNKHIILKLYSIPKEYLIDMADLERLVHVLKTQSSIITLQMKQVFELYNDIKEFQKECMGMATKADYDIDLVETSKLLKKGLDFKIYQPILSVLLTKLQKKQWLLLYKETLESAGTSVNVTSDFLKNLLDTGIQLRVDEPLLINVSETLKGVTKFNLKFDELFKKRKSNHLCKIPIADIEHLLNILNSNIGAFIEEEIKCFLLNIHDSVNASRTGNFTFANKLKYKNDELKNRLISRVNSNYGFLDDELVSYYNQSTNDRRMNKLDVPPNCESVCKKELKKLNDWLKNFHFYFKDLRHLNDLVAKTARCFNLENDRYLHENDDLYCFCRSSDDGHTMVQCEICKDWYHSECLNTETLSNEYIEMTLEQKSFLLKTNEEDNVFICSLCYSGQINLKKYDGIKFQDLQKMLIDSINLLIVPEDSSIIKKLFEFYEISLNYKRFLSGTIFGQASDVTIATAAVANNNQGNKLEIPLGLSTEKCKFYLRKLLGGNCHLTEEIKIMKRYIRKHDINELNKLKRRKMEIITGYPLCEQPKEMNKSFISLPNILDSSMSKSKKTMINDELNVMTQENL